MSDLESDDAVIEQWLQSARSDLVYAQIAPPEGAMYEQPAFHAQQAVEKALKALMLSLEEEPPYIHDLKALLALLRDKTPLPETFDAASDLTPYAAATRYPSSLRPVSREDWEQAVRIAREVVEWVEQQIAQS